jgi:hypothetical protein
MRIDVKVLGAGDRDVLTKVAPGVFDHTPDVALVAGCLAAASRTGSAHRLGRASFCKRVATV